MSEQFFSGIIFLIEIHQHFGGLKLKIKKFQLFYVVKCNIIWYIPTYVIYIFWHTVVVFFIFNKKITSK